jgi:hypothetical protein
VRGDEKKREGGWDVDEIRGGGEIGEGGGVEAKSA